MDSKFLAFDALIGDLKMSFDKVKDNRHHNTTYSLGDTLMSGFAIFSLKSASLLEFEQDYENRSANLHNIYHISSCPSDTNLRKILDKLPANSLASSFDLLVKKLRSSNLLKDYHYLDKYLLLSNDGTQYFSSKTINCSNCCSKNHRNNSITYHHNMLTTSIVHPSHKEVFPVALEEISSQDGTKKNDCELSAVKRLIPQIKQRFPQQKIIMLEDALYANAPHIESLQKEFLDYIIGVKPKGHRYLFEQYHQADYEEICTENGGVKSIYRFTNDLTLNKSSDLKVNFVHYQEVDVSTGKVLKNFTWITSLKLTAKNIEKIVKAGRSRWKIENETFNTLKNQGYNFEHNFGHGKENLAVILAQLMFLAFLVDQIQQRAHPLFQKAWLECQTKTRLWRKLRETFDLIICPDMTTIYKIIAKMIKLKVVFQE